MRTVQRIAENRLADAVDVVARGSEKKKIETVKFLIGEAKGRDEGAVEALVAVVKEHRFFGNSTVKSMILEYVESASEAGGHIGPGDRSLLAGEAGIKLLKTPGRHASQLVP